MPKPHAAAPWLRMQWVWLAVGGLLVWSPAWRVTHYWCVYVHELGHVVAALVAGGRVHAIRVHKDGSGATEWGQHQERGLVANLHRRTSRITVLLSGYPAGGVFAVALVALVCPHCGTRDDIAERNIATSFDAIERVTICNGTVTFAIQSPGSGDWEGAGWVCLSCGKDVTLPGSGYPVDFDYV